MLVSGELPPRNMASVIVCQGSMEGLVLVDEGFGRELMARGVAVEEDKSEDVSVMVVGRRDGDADRVGIAEPMGMRLVEWDDEFALVLEDITIELRRRGW